MKGKKWRKAVSWICILSLFALGISSCGNSGQKNSGDSEVIEISIGDIPSAETDPVANQICMERIADFEKNNPDIKIKPDTYVFSPDSYIAMAEAGTLPTMYHVPFTQAKTIIDMEYSADVTEELKKNGIYDQISDVILEKISYNGKIFLIPEACYDSGLAFNMDLMEQAGLINDDGTPKAPTTWDELVETAQIIKQKTGKAGFVLPTTKGVGGWRFMPLAWSYGAVFEEQEDGKWKANLDSPEAVAALQFIKDLKWKYDVLPANALVDNEEVQKLMGTGEAGMTLSEPIQASKYVQYGLDLKSIGMAQMPAGPEKHVTLIGGTYSVIKNGASSKEIEACIRWLIETGAMSIELTDEVKENINKAVELEYANNTVVGAETITPFKADSPVTQYKSQLMREKANVNLDYVKLYNNKDGIAFQEEEPIETSALYQTLSACMQEVLTNKDADCAEVLRKASSDFQKNHLDNIK